MSSIMSRVRSLSTDEQIEEELCAVVDLGGCVDTVFVNHRVYGRMEAELKVDPFFCQNPS